MFLGETYLINLIAVLTGAARRSITAVLKLPLVQHAWMPVRIMVLRGKSIREKVDERNGEEEMEEEERGRKTKLKSNLLHCDEDNLYHLSSCPNKCAPLGAASWTSFFSSSLLGAVTTADPGPEVESDIEGGRAVVGGRGRLTPRCV